jgi:hypothetical protein
MEYMSDTKGTMEKVYLDIVVSSEDFAQIAWIMKKKDLADQVLHTYRFPNESDPTVVKAFFQAGMDNFAQAQVEEQSWWMKAIQTYKISQETYFDTAIGKFYRFSTRKPDDL